MTYAEGIKNWHWEYYISTKELGRLLLICENEEEHDIIIKELERRIGLSCSVK